MNNLGPGGEPGPKFLWRRVGSVLRQHRFKPPAVAAHVVQGPRCLPTEELQREGGIGPVGGDVAFAAGREFVRDLPPRGALKGGDDFEHRGAGAGAASQRHLRRTVGPTVRAGDSITGFGPPRLLISKEGCSSSNDKKKMKTV